MPRKNPPSPKMEILLSNERKIERAFRSKCGLDSIFELAQMAPWRETSILEAPVGKTILHLDFKNFYPSIICAHKFPHPAKLRLIENPQGRELDQPGLCRCLLYPGIKTTEKVRKHHPFQIQNGKKGTPFLIENRPIDALLHTVELPIWAQWFDIEITEAILSEEAVKHPLAHRTLLALIELNNLEETGSTEIEAIRTENKLKINLASTTPKIGSPHLLPSPYGVHCLPSQISGLGRALLCQTTQLALNADPENELLMTNTDGFFLSTKNPEKTLNELTKLGILGPNPGQLREKSRGDEAVILGPNLWWLLENNKIIASCGIGESKESVPLFHRYTSATPTGERTEKIATIHLADWRHRLDHQTLRREKFLAPENPREAPELAAEEKKRSFFRTLRTLRSLRKRTKLKAQ